MTSALAKYGCCAVAELEVWQPEQNCVSSGHTVLAKLVPLVPVVEAVAGNCLPPPAACTGGAISVMLVVEEEPAPIQAWIHTSMVAAHAEGSATQQLCPPPTLRMNSDCAGLVRFTSGPAAW